MAFAQLVANFILLRFIKIDSIFCVCVYVVEILQSIDHSHGVTY